MQRNIKIVLVGPTDSTKFFITELSNPVDNLDNKDNYKSSLGLSFTHIHYGNCTFQIWTTHNQKRFYDLNSMYLKGVQAIIYVNASPQQKQMTESHSLPNNVLKLDIVYEHPDQKINASVYLDKIKNLLIEQPSLQMEMPENIKLKEETEKATLPTIKLQPPMLKTESDKRIETQKPAQPKQTFFSTVLNFFIPQKEKDRELLSFAQEKSNVAGNKL